MSLPSMIALAAALIVMAVTLGGLAVWAWRRERYTSALVAAQAAADAWREERNAEIERRKRIEQELDHARGKISALEARVDELEKRPDLRSLELLVEARTDRILAAIEKQTGGTTA